MKKSEYPTWRMLGGKLTDVQWKKAAPKLVVAAFMLIVLFAPATVPTTPFSVHDDDDGDGLFNEDGDQDGRDDDPLRLRQERRHGRVGVPAPVRLRREAVGRPPRPMAPKGEGARGSRESRGGRSRTGGRRR